MQHRVHPGWAWSPNAHPCCYCPVMLFISEVYVLEYLVTVINTDRSVLYALISSSICALTALRFYYDENYDEMVVGHASLPLHLLAVRMYVLLTV